MRVYNGPGPNALRSDDIAVDIAIGFFVNEVWLTGTVREADGVGYDTATIKYGLFGASAIPGQEVIVELSQTTERAVALDINDDASAAQRGIFVTGTIKDVEAGDPLIQTFKIISGPATDPVWIRLFGFAVADTPETIIAPRRNNGTASIYVFGQSLLSGTGDDQVGVHYIQP